MNDFRFACPHCRQRLRCDGRLAGRTVRCPGCGRAIVLLPGGTSLAASPPENSAPDPAPDIATPSPKPYKEP